MNLIIPHLYVGDMNDAVRVAGEMHRVSVMGMTEMGRSPENYDVLQLQEKGKELFYIDINLMTKACEAVKGYVDKGWDTLLHCAYGMERSPMTCMLYLIYYHRMDLLRAKRFVEKQRPETIFHPDWWPKHILMKYWIDAFETSSKEHIIRAMEGLDHELGRTQPGEV